MEAKKKSFVSVLKYVITGTSTWLIDNGLFTILLRIFGEHDLFTVFGFTVKASFLFTYIAMLVGFVFSFFVNRAWTFQSGGNVRKQMTRCFLLLIFNMTVTALVVNGVSSLGQNVFGLSKGGCELLTNAAKYTMSGVTGVWNYFIYQKWVYKD